MDLSDGLLAYEKPHDLLKGSIVHVVCNIGSEQKKQTVTISVSLHADSCALLVSVFPPVWKKSDFKLNFIFYFFISFSLAFIFCSVSFANVKNILLVSDQSKTSVRLLSKQVKMTVLKTRFR